MMRPVGWVIARDLLREEMIQCEYEGRPVPAHARERFAELAEGVAADAEQIREIYEILDSAPVDPSFPYWQPYGLDDIRSSRPGGARRNFAPPPDGAALLDRFQGALTGRFFGCALGKPVEMWPRARIRAYLTGRGEWPLTDYFSVEPPAGWTGPIPGCPLSCRENIAYAEADDDINYTLIPLAVLEETGRDFTWRHVAGMWNSRIPYNWICTAETQAILNYNLATPRCGNGPVCTAEFTSRFNNPYREWIGAQIRADGWGYAAAGNPELAAEFAWRDAHWTHRANGVYGEMFIASMIAGAFVTDEFEELVGIGLGEIPRRCRLAEEIGWAMENFRECPDWESFMERFDRHFAGMSCVHTVNNCVIVLTGLRYGGMDPVKSAEIAVMCGLDTDCNGATAGSIAGAASGASRFASRGPAAALHDRVRSAVYGFGDSRIGEIADRYRKISRKMIQ